MNELRQAAFHRADAKVAIGQSAARRRSAGNKALLIAAGIVAIGAAVAVGLRKSTRCRIMCI